MVRGLQGTHLLRGAAEGQCAELREAGWGVPPRLK